MSVLKENIDNSSNTPTLNTIYNDLQMLHEIYTLLVSQNDLSPNNVIVNNTLTKLVSTISNLQDVKNLDILHIIDKYNHLLAELPRLCACAEIEMEKWWCKRILDDKDTISNFWYLENYQNLVTAEQGLINNQKNTNLVFLGSGAFPLTAIIWARKFPDCKIKCIDHDKQACDLSQSLVRKVGLSNSISIYCEHSEQFKPNTDDIVLCASLLDIKDLYQNLFQDKVSRIIVRDSEGLSRFIYQPSPKPPSEIYIQKRKTKTSSERINISRYYEIVCHEH